MKNFVDQLRSHLNKEVIFPGGISLTPKLVSKPSLCRQVLMRHDDLRTDNLPRDVEVFSPAQFLREFFQHRQSWTTLDQEGEYQMAVYAWKFLDEGDFTYVRNLGG